jgi:hypothetical protein
MHMTEEELSAIVESKLADRLAARLAADRARVREEVIRELRREIDREHYNKINAKHPSEDKYGGLGPEGHAARLKAMDERARADNEWMDRVNAKSVEGDLRAQRAAHKGGKSGFTIK